MTALVTELDPAIDRAIQRCLEKDPSARPASALSVAASLPGGDPLAAAIARGELLNETVRSALGGLAFFVLLFVLTIIARRQWIATAIVVLLLALDSASTNAAPVAGAIATAVGWTVMMIALQRFGLLMFVLSVFTGNIVSRMPLTFDLSVWFAPAACVAMAVLLGLALYGAWTCANLRTVFPKILGEE